MIQSASYLIFLKFIPKLLDDNSKSKWSTLFGSYLIIFFKPSPKLLQDKFNFSSYKKFLGSYYIPFPRYFIFSAYYPKLLPHKSNSNCITFLGKYFKFSPKYFILSKFIPK